MKKKYRIPTYKTHTGPRGSPEQWQHAAKLALGIDTTDYLSDLGIMALPKTENELKTIYRNKIKQCHPDIKGEDSHDLAAKVNAAYKFALSLLSKTTTSSSSSSSRTDIRNSSSGRTDTGLRSRSLIPITMSDATTYLNSNIWCCQEKKDGKHIIIKATDDGVTIANKQGLATTIQVQIQDAVKKYKNIILNGELIGDVLWVFDALNIPGNYQQRYKWLVDNIKNENSIKLVPAYFGIEKLEFYEKMKKEGKEGVVFKNLQVDEQLKCKFYATLSAIVCEKVTGKSSVILYVLDDDNNRVYLGHCSVLGKCMPPAGSVVEVRYLYCHRNGKLAQTVFLGIRDDVDVKDCTIKQIKYKEE